MRASWWLSIATTTPSAPAHTFEAQAGELRRVVVEGASLGADDRVHASARPESRCRAIAEAVAAAHVGVELIRALAGHRRKVFWRRS